MREIETGTNTEGKPENTFLRRFKRKILVKYWLNEAMLPQN